MILSEQELRRIDRHMSSSRVREQCGLLLSVAGRVTYMRCENEADDDEEFSISPLTIRSCVDMIVGVIHSHPRGSAAMSDMDRAFAWPQWSYGVWADGTLVMYDWIDDEWQETNRWHLLK